MSKRIVSAQGGALSAEGRQTRRAALGALAGALIVPRIGAIAAPLDPIFAAIERHKAAWAAVGAMAPTVDEVVALRRGVDITQVDWDAYERASAVEQQSLDDLLATAPATIVGIRAAIGYLVGFDDGCLSDSAKPFLAALLKSPLFAC